MAAKTTQAEMERAIAALLDERGAGKTVCPSEVARAVAGTNERVAWEPLMEPVRAAAFAMVERGELEITQRGRVVDGRTAKGPVRLRWREK